MRLYLKNFLIHSIKSQFESIIIYTHMIIHSHYK